MDEWHIVTGEYPPDRGGVADYTRRVAAGLAAAGASVHVWCPTSDQRPTTNDGAGRREVADHSPIDGGELPDVTIHRELGRLGRADLVRVGALLDGFGGPRRILLQWVPHGFGFRAMNVAFCAWVLARARLRHDRVFLMVHEAQVSFGRSRREDVIALVNRLMSILLLQAAERVWVSTPGWEASLRPYALGRPLAFEWLPVPTNVEPTGDLAEAAAVRSAHAPPDGPLIGHFGTYGAHVEPQLRRLVPELLRLLPGARLLLLGRGGAGFREDIVRRDPELADRLVAPGQLADAALSAHIGACDLFVQPYPEGLTTRRTSTMALIAHGRPVVSTSGALTEEAWRDGVVLVPLEEGVEALVRAAASLAKDREKLETTGAAGERLYRERFGIEHTLAALLAVDGPTGSADPGRPPSLAGRST